ncbi:MAG: hypothetical protein RIT27_889 [Pseudomonadota bacterium]
MQKLRKNWVSILFISLIMSNVQVFAEIKLGINSVRGELQTIKRWEALRNYFSEQLGQPVKIIVLMPGKLVETALKEEIDFVLTMPLAVVILMEKGHYIPLATLNTLNGTQFGGVIVSKKGSGITKSEDLKGKKVISMEHGKGAGGYLFQVYHLYTKGINPEQDFSAFKEGKNQDDLVMGVKLGLFDAAFVRTGILESLEKAGKIKIEDFEIVDQQKTDGFPLLRTTILYPEFGLLAKPHLDPKLVEEMKRAALKLTPEHPAAQQSDIKGFVEPISYEPVKTLLQTLKIVPFN